MKNFTKVSLYSAAALALSAVSAVAQQPTHVSVKVPFEFMAGNAVMPAGAYDFQEGQNGIVTVSSMEQHKSVLVMTNPEINWRMATQSSVKFDKSGDVYRLSEVDLLGGLGRKVIHFEHEVLTK